MGEEPFGAIEQLLSPSRDDRLYAGKCHPADTARPADFVFRAAARPAAHPANEGTDAGSWHSLWEKRKLKFNALKKLIILYFWADAVDTLGEDVAEEAADELADVERHCRSFW
jgi:hypothetical protein